MKWVRHFRHVHPMHGAPEGYGIYAVTACGADMGGSTAGILKTTLLAGVTCKRCKRTKAFQKAIQEKS